MWTIEREGITLRDFFAALAMAAMMKAELSYKNAAIQAYKQADEMLKEREREKEDAS